jgi:hypothetical protein
MRRSIAVCEPHFTYAGHCYNWKFVYTTASTLPKGTLLRFDLLSQGREIDWETPTTNLKKHSNVIYLLLEEEGKPIAGEEFLIEDEVVPNFDFKLPKEVKAGEQFSIVMGVSPTLRGTKNAKGNCAQKFLQRRRPFHLYIDPKGKGKFTETEVFSIDIRGNVLHTIRALVPSFVIKNKRFDIVLRFEDQYGNLTSHAPSDTLIDLTYEHLRENLNWNLFVPETGFIILPNLYFNEAGIYKIHLKNTKTGDCFFSSPIKCFPDGDAHLFWGQLHGETERFDASENIENCLRHTRDEKAFNFYGVSPFENAEEISNSDWKLVTQFSADFNENERYSTFLGFQWLGEEKEEGLRHFIYLKDGKSILRKKESKNGSLKKIYRQLPPKECIAIPSFTMGSATCFDFKDFNPDVERVVEIYNAWGSSECKNTEGNPKPILGKGKLAIKESVDGSIVKALNANCRFGFVAGGLDDRGIYSKLFEADQEQYMPGLTAIFAESHTREALFEALYNRSCYATTGERIILGIDIVGKGMGSELSTEHKPGLLVNRHISGYVAGTANLTKIEIIRNGEVIHTIKPEGYTCDYTYDDMVSLSSVVLKAKGKDVPSFVYYYLRVFQEDGHIGWSSPIWVDLVPTSKKGKK